MQCHSGSSKWERLVGLAALVLPTAAYAVLINQENRLSESLISGLLVLGGLFAYRLRTHALRNLFLSSLVVFAAGRYLIWRFSFTLATEGAFNVVATYALLGIELLYIASFMLFLYVFHHSWRKSDSPVVQEKTSVGPVSSKNNDVTVDIFITTYDESETLVRRTVAAACTIAYSAKKVFILDDGSRAWCRELAGEFGCTYIAREVAENAKNGNINNALTQSDGELLLILDADHIVSADILGEAVALFVDDQLIGLVQTGCAHLNSSAIEENLEIASLLPSEYEVIYSHHLRAADSRNSVSWIGSGAIIRREAIEKAGGMSDSMILDLDFTIRMNQLGYRSVYLPAPRTLVLHPESLDAYITQQRRWSRGFMKLMLFRNPMILPGLTFAQRLSHTSILVGRCTPLPRLILLLFPAAFLLIDLTPIFVPSITDGLCIQLAFCFLAFLTAMAYLENRWHLIYRDLYEVIRAPWILLEQLGVLLNPSGLRFRTTPKGLELDGRESNLLLVMPHIVLLIFLLIAAIVGTYRLFTDGPFLAISINWLLNLYQILILSCAVFSAIEKPRSWRTLMIETEIPVGIGFLSTDSNSCSGLDSGLHRCVVVRASDDGFEVEVPEPIPEIYKSAEIVFDCDSDQVDSLRLPVRVQKNFVSEAQGTVCFDLAEKLDTENYLRLIEKVYSRNPLWQKEIEVEKGSLFQAVCMLMSLPLQRLSATLGELRKDRQRVS